MTRFAVTLLALSALLCGGDAQNSTTEDIKLRWLGSTPKYQSGTTFGVPWPRGKYPAGKTSFSITADGGEQINLQTWETALWPDNSIKWTGHAIPASDAVPGAFTLRASTAPRPATGKLAITYGGNDIKVDTGKIRVAFPRSGDVLVRTVEVDGKVVGKSGKLVLKSQDLPAEQLDVKRQAQINYYSLEGVIEEVTVSNSSTTRALITARGKHEVREGGTHVAWLPWIVRFYLYEGSEAIRIVHTVIYDGKPKSDFIAGLGITFEVPLQGEELYNRHIRFGGVDGGLLNEAVQSLTGLRRDPGAAVKKAQVEGQATPAKETWDVRVSSRLQWIPTWNDYLLDQLSPDGFTLKKRTKKGYTWINIPGGTRASGLAYLGGGTKGGLAIAHRDFWKKYPTSLAISDATLDTGRITLWLYSPSGPVLDLRPYHDGLGLTGNYTAQLDALEITYEDWEEGFDTPYGIARTNEVFLYAFGTTPSRDKLASLSVHANNPPVLLPQPEYIKSAGALGKYWSIPATSGPSAAIESNLKFLLEFYQKQVQQRRWFGFLDYGDFMHTYDNDRSQWRYDVGGYGWDNSELSPDIFIWLQFLRTGDENVYRFGEAQVRHTSEVDVYHLGKWKGLGTRHGVLHYGDSAKQVRIAQPQYRKVFYYLTGGDERVGEIIHETMSSLDTFQVLDGRRKVRTDGYKPSPTAIDIALGTDWSGLAAAWLLEWERRGPRWEEARDRLNSTLTGIAKLKNGFVTGAALLNPTTGVLSPPLGDPDNKGLVDVSHLSAVFGLAEVIAELIDHWGPNLPAGFEQAWFDYAYYYGASAAEQTAKYGKAFPTLILKQGHSRLTAYLAYRTNNATLATRAWNEFLKTDGLLPSAPWKTEQVNGSKVLIPVEQATWISTNDFALYGYAAIENLALAKGGLV